ncbi:hypothetical protein TNIN_314861 [Trichonephila inaurata madagascariensis]|uniref:Uncharacterized protein n=1 Tax=Trichonephila inaurata madagascariensis TaxID=2747483 RepID=A0A8X6Y1K6_9ARAC|nr:hypothetical protein TNIN_314861 [Trichonephila inaurata madagascariensis]
MQIQLHASFRRLNGKWDASERPIGCVSCSFGVASHLQMTFAVALGESDKYKIKIFSLLALKLSYVRIKTLLIDELQRLKN